MRFMNERHGRILRFLKPYIEPYIYIYIYKIRAALDWNFDNDRDKKKRSSIAIRVHRHYYTLIFRRTSPFPVRFDELPGSRNGQSSALSRREHARDSGPITRLAHYRSAVEWQVRREERARRAHAAACTYTRPCPFTQKGKAAESGWQSAMT